MKSNYLVFLVLLFATLASAQDLEAFPGLFTISNGNPIYGPVSDDDWVRVQEDGQNLLYLKGVFITSWESAEGARQRRKDHVGSEMGKIITEIDSEATLYAHHSIGEGDRAAFKLAFVQKLSEFTEVTDIEVGEDTIAYKVLSMQWYHFMGKDVGPEYVPRDPDERRDDYSILKQWFTKAREGQCIPVFSQILGKQYMFRVDPTDRDKLQRAMVVGTFLSDGPQLMTMTSDELRVEIEGSVYAHSPLLVNVEARRQGR